MIRIRIPSDNIAERRYAVDMLLGEFLGLETVVEEGPGRDYEMLLPNGKRLVVRDRFFGRYRETKSYLVPEALPKKVYYGTNAFTVFENIPVIFGTPELLVREDTIICDADLFASAFFMLSRWEEYVNKKRDHHGRFPAYASLAYREGFLERPVVNEYAEMLWGMLRALGYKGPRRQKKFEPVLTHDVDNLYRCTNLRRLVRQMAGDILKRRDWRSLLDKAAGCGAYYLGMRKDPFDWYDWLMDRSEAVGLKDRFYFMAGGRTRYDNRYRVDARHTVKLMRHIVERGHVVGIHPSYDAYNNIALLAEEKSRLEKALGLPVSEGREHYLRFEVPTTWQIWDDLGFEIDSTAGYADKEGFRCGTGDAYSVFNILTRKRLKLKERPLIVMDEVEMYIYDHIDMATARERIERTKKRAQKVGSAYTVLFHQCMFANQVLDYPALYENAVLEI